MTQRSHISSPLPRPQRGLTLIELVLSIAVGLAVVSVSVVLLGRANANTAGKNALSGLLTMTAAVQNHFGQGTNYAGMAPASLINSGLVPSSMISGAQIVDAFSGVVQIAPGTPTGGSANTAFTILYPQVPRDQCVGLIMGAGEAFTRIQVGFMSGSSFTPVYTAKDSRSNPIVSASVAAAQTQCAYALNAMQFMAL